MKVDSSSNASGLLDPDADHDVGCRWRLWRARAARPAISPPHPRTDLNYGA
jgi:hypothetical protein